MVVSGLLQIHLVDARVSDPSPGFWSPFLILLSLLVSAGRMDPYVILRYMGQERKSRVLREGGSNPTWNETFTFQAEYPAPDHQHNLVLKIMDEDTFSADDFAGAATINVGDLLQLGAEKGSAELPPHRYRVVLADRSYQGDIRVGVSFKRKVSIVSYFSFRFTGQERQMPKLEALAKKPLKDTVDNRVRQSSEKIKRAGEKEPKNHSPHARKTRDGIAMQEFY
ncbi:unnamed protein product [Spirodela intermedia]|uniref:C2 domain-containing protein n=1 Tax=Spirodela intermedia TaxID=51605 RepID=A0A7I8IBB1_SPIIN|nr:unnamed protein product [Spirodela intermedia]CAA6654989.1 unnamed protein product [Spirodela intermedia]